MNKLDMHILIDKLHTINVQNFRKDKKVYYQFDAVVTPTNGHSVSLKNVRYSSDGGLSVPRACGFSLTLTSSLENKLLKICKKLSATFERSKKKDTKSVSKKKAPKLFDRSKSEKLKNKIISGDMNDEG